MSFVKIISHKITNKKVGHVINVFSFVMCPIFFDFKLDFDIKKTSQDHLLTTRSQEVFCDIANRMNGFERPKPNEGYALENDISMKSQSAPSLWDTSPFRGRGFKFVTERFHNSSMLAL